MRDGLRASVFGRRGRRHSLTGELVGRVVRQRHAERLGLGRILLVVFARHT